MSEKIEHTAGPWEAVSYNWNTKSDAGHPIWNGRVASPDKVNKGQREPCILSTSAFGIFGKTAREAKHNAELIALAPTAPHSCSIPDCPGNLIQQKLKLLDEITKPGSWYWALKQIRAGRCLTNGDLLQGRFHLELRGQSIHLIGRRTDMRPVFDLSDYDRCDWRIVDDGEQA